MEQLFIGAVTGGIIAAKTGKNVWAGIVIGAAAVGLIGSGVGAVAGLKLAGSAFALYSAVVAGGKAAITCSSATGGGAVAKKLYHYTSSNPSKIIKQGLKPGISGKVFTTPTRNLSPLQAQIDLELPPNRGLPNHLIEINLRTLTRLGYNIPQAQQVARNFNMLGGGLEVIFDYPIPPEALKIIR